MIAVDVVDGVRRVTLQRPEKRNALTPGALASLAAAIEREDAARVVLITGEGPVFCAGFDLDLCRDDGPEQRVMREFLTLLHHAIRAMRQCDRPIVLCAHGAAVAGGCALLGGADVVVTDRAARLGYPVTRLGISPAVSAPYLRQSVHDGPTRTRLLDAALITGEQAHAMGLVHTVAEAPGDATAAAIGCATALAAKPAAALAATKAWLRAVAPVGLAEEALATSLSLVAGDEAMGRLRSLWRTP